MKKCGLPYLTVLWVLSAPYTLLALEIEGRVVALGPDRIEVSNDSEYLPDVGDKVHVFHRIPGVDAVATVASGWVTDAHDDIIVVKIDHADCPPKVGHLAKVTSESPRKKVAPAPPPAAGGAEIGPLPEDAEAWTNRANLRLSASRAEAKRGLDPRKELDLALEDFGRALALGPDYSPAWLGRGNAWRERGEAEEARGGDPRGAYRRAIDDYERAAQLPATSAVVYKDSAHARLRLAQAEWGRGEDPRTTIEKAIEDCGKAIEAYPDDAETYSLRGNAWCLLGPAKGEVGVEVRPSLENAVADFDRALALDPEDVDAYNTRGEAWMRLGWVHRDSGEDPSGAQEKALADFDKALAMGPVRWQCHWNRGCVLEDMGRYEEAVREFDFAIERAGDLAPDLKPKRDNAKAKAAPGARNDQR